MSSLLLGQRDAELIRALPRCRSGVPLQSIKAPVTVNFPEDDRTQRDLDQMEEDEEEMRRANSEVMQMQKRMLEGGSLSLPATNLRRR